MRVLLTGSSLQCCDMVKAVLESRGITCMLKNEYSSMESGSTFARPELWVVDDAQFEEAKIILREYETAHITAEDSIELLPASVEVTGPAEATRRRSLRFKIVVALGLVALVAGVLWVGPSLRRASAKTYYDWGCGHYANGDYKRAITAFGWTIHLSPRLWQAYNNRGLAKYKEGNFDGAIADFSRAIELNPKGANAYYSRGYAKHGKNDLDGAIADYTRAIDLDSRMDFAYSNRGSAKNQKGDLDGAIADLTRAIELNPQDSHSHAIRGRAKHWKGEIDEAVVDLNRAIELDPKTAFAYEYRGSARAYKGDMAGAIADYDQAIALGATDAYTYADRGHARLRKDDIEGAIADYCRAIELDPKHVYAYLGRGSAKLGQADISGATADYNRASALAPTDAFVRVCLGALAHAQGHYEEAVAEYKKGIKPNLKDGSAYLGLGGVALALGRYGEAVTEYKKVLAISPPDAHACTEARMGIAWAFLQQDDLARAEQELTEAARLGVESFSDGITFSIGIVRARQGKTDEAVNLWKKALSLCKGTNLTKRIDRAIYKIATGQGEEGLAEMQEILAKTKLPPDFIRSTVEGLEMLKRCPVKIEGLQKIIDLLNETKKTGP